MKKKLLSIAAIAFAATMANAQYCGGGPSSTIDSNLEGADLVGETTSIAYTGCPGVTGVEDATSEEADLSIGGSYTADLHWGTCGGNYTWAGSAWIDFDGSGTYDADELIGDETGYGDVGTISYPFTVPGDAIEGSTRMRVVQREGGSLPLDPCAGFSWGSSVEFSINLVSPCEDMTITVSDYELCEGEMLTLDAEGVGEITWTGGAPDGVPFDPGPPGVYTYLPTSDDDGDCPVADADAIVIEVFGLPTVIAGAGDLNFCDDENITLSSAGDADEYEWNDGEELDLMPGPGTYTFTLAGTATTGGCAGEEITDMVEVTVHELPTITASADADPICIGTSVVLSGGGGVSYEWDVAGVVDGEAYTPASVGTGTYTVIGTDENGCTGSASVDVEVVDEISIAGTTTDEIMGGDGAISIDITGGVASYTFDWDTDELDDFDDDEDLTGLEAGTYTVVVRGSTGCESTATFVVNSQLGIDDLGAENITIYPNPTIDEVNIQLAGTFQYELITINGDVILRGTATDNEMLSLGSFADGIYLLNVMSEGNTATLKVVKK